MKPTNVDPFPKGEEPKSEPIMVEVDRNDIETKAKILVAHDFTETFFPDVDHIKATAKDFYVVWKVKALQNWKVLISTDIISGQYWEVTYNGDKNETYVDHYVKRHNQAITDEAYASMP
jgi:hypothetical protein